MGNIVRIVSVLQIILEVRRVNKNNQDNVLEMSIEALPVLFSKYCLGNLEGS